MTYCIGVAFELSFFLSNLVATTQPMAQKERQNAIDNLIAEVSLSEGHFDPVMVLECMAEDTNKAWGQWNIPNFHTFLRYLPQNTFDQFHAAVVDTFGLEARQRNQGSLLKLKADMAAAREKWRQRCEDDRNAFEQLQSMLDGMFGDIEKLEESIKEKYKKQAPDTVTIPDELVNRLKGFIDTHPKWESKRAYYDAIWQFMLQQVTKYGTKPVAAIMARLAPRMDALLQR